MKTKLTFLLTAMLLIPVFSCVSDNPGNEAEENIPEIVESQVVQGVISVKFFPETGEAVAANLASVGTRAFEGLSALDGIYESLDITSMRRIFPPAGRFEERTRREGMHLWYYVHFKEDVTVTRAVSSFAGLPGVDKVEAVSVITLLGEGPAVVVTPAELEQMAGQASGAPQPAAAGSLPFDDDMLPWQWHYYNDGSRSIWLEGADMNAITAWRVSTGHPDVIVSIVDGGVDRNHEDLAANYWINEAELNGVAGVDDDDNGYVDDIYGWNFFDDVAEVIAHDHGTHVGGTVAAVNNNFVGGGGIAGGNGTPNSGVKLMSCQMFIVNPDDPSQSPGRNGGPAIKYGADNGAVISQNSWTGDSSAVVRDAIDYFVKYAGMDEYGNQEGPMAGGIVIFAAGNYSTSTIYYPAGFTNTVAVAAMGPKYIKASYSNYGSWIDITAPGGDIKAYGTYAGVLSTLPNNSYGFYQGTSMACPHVSGVAALMVSHWGVGKPGLTAEWLREKLEASVNDIDRYNLNFAGKLGSGYLDAGQALYDNTGTAPGRVYDLAAKWETDGASVDWTIPAHPEHGIPARFRLYFSDSPISYEDEPLAEIFISPLAKVGDSEGYAIGDLTVGTDYYIGLTSVDMFGNASEMTVLSGRTLATIPPYQSREFESPFRIDDMNSTYTLDLSEYFTDESGDGMTFARRISDTGIISGSVSGGILTLTPKVERGSAEITVTATNTYGSASADFSISILHMATYTPPVLIREFEGLYYISDMGTPLALTLSDHFTDQDGDQLTFTVEVSDQSVVSANVSGSTLALTPKNPGNAVVTVTASDGYESAKGSFTILARDGSKEVDLFPNPVSSTLKIRMGQEVNGVVSVRFHNSTGVMAWETNATVTPYEPGTLNVSSLAPGQYTVTVTFGGKEYRGTVMKI